MSSAEVEERSSDGGSNGESNGSAVLDALTSKELLVPAALSAAAAVAATKGPDLVRQLVAKTEETGEREAKRLGEKGAEGAKESISGGGLGAVKGLVPGLGSKSGKGGGKGKKTRRLPIQRWTDVAVPVSTAYEKWTEFESFPNFMHRVLSIEAKGDKKVSWQEKIWFSKRQWEGEITERRKNDRIVWKTKSGTSHSGIVSFHPLGDNLTRVMVTIDFHPTGMFEKMASGLRFAKRAVQSDLARFKAFVEFDDAKGLAYGPPSAAKPDGDESSGNGRKAEKDDGQREGDRRDRESRRRERRDSAESK